MSSQPLAGAADLFAHYQPAPGAYDEWRDETGQPRLHWQALTQHLEHLGQRELVRRQEAARRTIQENGITYNVHGDATGNGDHPWALDLIPWVLAAAEWRDLERGLTQRARLLNALLADLYGPQEILKQGLLPAELVFDNPAFLRACHGMSLPQDLYLHLYGADIGRSADGRWRVLSDLTQAPAGTGYVLENRIVLSRLLADLFRDSQVQRMALFFQHMREMLAGLAPRHRDNPSIVMLSEGPQDETYFGQAYLARYLGFALVEGEDLAVRDQSVFLKMLGGLQPVDVILRRVPDADCDPLEWQGSANLGAAGLVQSVRSGQVAVANALGSGLLENPALLPFLPELCRRLLSEEMELPSLPTWWCGQPDVLAHVLDRLDELTVVPVLGGAHSAPVQPGQLEDTERDQLITALREHPHRYVAQEPMTWSCAPTLDGDRVVARHVFLRAYLTAHEGSYQCLPGGLARAIETDGNLAAALRGGGVSKDTWVLSDEPVSAFSLLRPAGAPVELSRGGGDLPSRMADNLFWLGRYVERADYMVRAVRVVLIKLSERPEGTTLPYLNSLLHLLDVNGPSGLEQDEQHYAALDAEVQAFLFDEGRPGGFRSTVESIRRTAGIVRDRLSADTWRMLNRIELTLQETSEGARTVGDVLEMLDRMITRIAAFGGVSMESMTRGQGWRFLDMGRRQERALQTVQLMTCTLVESSPYEGALLEDVLNIADSSITYRRRYLTNLQVAPVVDLLLTDETNPRSVAFQLAALQEHVSKLPQAIDQVGPTEEERVALQAMTAVRLVDVVQLASILEDGRRVHFQTLLASLTDLLPQLSETITRRFLSHAQAARQLEAPRLTG